MKSQKLPSMIVKSFIVGATAAGLYTAYMIARPFIDFHAIIPEYHPMMSLSFNYSSNSLSGNSETGLVSKVEGEQ
jgi:hypothetical protein